MRLPELMAAFGSLAQVEDKIANRNEPAACLLFVFAHRRLATYWSREGMTNTTSPPMVPAITPTVKYVQRLQC